MGIEQRDREMLVTTLLLAVGAYAIIVGFILCIMRTAALADRSRDERSPFAPSGR